MDVPSVMERQNLSRAAAKPAIDLAPAAWLAASREANLAERLSTAQDRRPRVEEPMIMRLPNGDDLVGPGGRDVLGDWGESSLIELGVFLMR